MDIVETLRRAVVDRFTALPTPARRTAVGLGIALFFSAAFLIGTDTGGPDTFLMNEAVSASR